jgi:DNA-binding HxlR family transcriptional regulator
VFPGDPDDYCPFIKAVEHLGDRWSLLILCKLGAVGPLGFNALATGVPGRISRSVLLDRLHRLEDLGLISRGTRHDREVPYRLTTAGHGLMPMLMELRRWAGTWLPDDPALVERDPDVLPGWLARRLDLAMLPRREVVLEITIRGRVVHRGWLVLRFGAEPFACLDDPMLDTSRYLYLDAGLQVMLPLATGRRDWSDAIDDGTVIVSGDPALAKELPHWFRPANDGIPAEGQQPPVRAVSQAPVAGADASSPK